MVVQVGFILGNPMCQLVANDIYISCKTSKNGSVTITKNHSSAIPKRIVILLIIMNILLDGHAQVVNRISSKKVVVKTPGTLTCIDNIFRILICWKLF